MTLDELIVLAQRYKIPGSSILMATPDAEDEVAHYEVENISTPVIGELALHFTLPGWIKQEDAEQMAQDAVDQAVEEAVEDALAKERRRTTGSK